VCRVLNGYLRPVMTQVSSPDRISNLQSCSSACNIHFLLLLPFGPFSISIPGRRILPQSSNPPYHPHIPPWLTLASWPPFVPTVCALSGHFSLVLPLDPIFRCVASNYPRASIVESLRLLPRINFHQLGPRRCFAQCPVGLSDIRSYPVHLAA
jgi:hypothetical protein